MPILKGPTSPRHFDATCRSLDECQRSPLGEDSYSTRIAQYLRCPETGSFCITVSCGIQGSSSHESRLALGLVMKRQRNNFGAPPLLIAATRTNLQSASQRPFGVKSTSEGSGSGARTAYIGREHDNESDLGFYGVRLYEPEYGRFLSTDVLWGKYLPLQP
ncbi:MAG: hypothetical protein FGM32_11695, partial [Candidatus Kapabacteria bacterium]|nr:hypothetical protein [Candidatus Kapabacteria bacterium]